MARSFSSNSALPVAENAKCSNFRSVSEPTPGAPSVPTKCTTAVSPAYNHAPGMGKFGRSPRRRPKTEVYQWIIVWSWVVRILMWSSLPMCIAAFPYRLRFRLRPWRPAGPGCRRIAKWRKAMRIIVVRQNRIYRRYRKSFPRAANAHPPRRDCPLTPPRPPLVQRRHCAFTGLTKLIRLP